MNHVFILPGILGSRLYSGSPVLAEAQEYWIDKLRLATTRCGGLTLAANGEDPAPGVGLQLYALDYIRDNYDDLVAALRAGLPASSWSVRVLPFDWRKEIRAEAGRVWTRIKAIASGAGDTIAIIGHSQGGLIARGCWALSRADSHPAPIRRLITLGTPHFGAWPPVQVLSYSGDYWDIFAGIVELALEELAPPGGPWSGVLRTLVTEGSIAVAKQIRATVASWPAFYQLMPHTSLVTPWQSVSPADCLNNSRWDADSQLRQRWIDEALEVWQPWLSDAAASVPPYSVLTCVAGDGHPTPAGVRGPLGSISTRLRAITENVGDGTVLTRSALLFGSKRYFVPVKHEWLPADAMILDNIAALVLEQRTTQPPGELVQTLGSPPISGYVPPAPVQPPGVLAAAEHD